MHPFERTCIRIRHQPWWRQKDWIWNLLRPGYDRFMEWTARTGLERVLNGTDRIRIHPRLRGIGETYEPRVWAHLMGQVRPGDVAADIGAHVGLYTIALAQRVGPEGMVIAVEPDSENMEWLRKNVTLNNAEARVQLVEAAAWSSPGWMAFMTGDGSESRIASASERGSGGVPTVTLDQLFKDRHLNLLKVDVEGCELEVLRGGRELLSSPSRSPRAIYLEVHPYAWPDAVKGGEELLGLLAQCGYRGLSLDGQPVKEILSWSEVIALKP